MGDVFQSLSDFEAKSSGKVRNFLRSTAQEVAHSSVQTVMLGLQRCVHTVIHILVRKKLRIKAKGRYPAESQICGA